VQIVLETHCEHLINRIRYEVYGKKLAENGVVIYYKPDAQSPFIRININRRGHYANEEGKEMDFPRAFLIRLLRNFWRSINGLLAGSLGRSVP